MSRNAAVVRRSSTAVVIPILGFGLLACGGGGPTSPTPPTSTITTTLLTQPFNGLEPDDVAFTDINGTGVLTGTVDWTFPTNDIDVYVTSTSCTAGDVVDLATRCTAFGRTTAVTAKPERLTVDGRQGGYRVWVANFGPTAESGTLQLTATVAR